MSTRPLPLHFVIQDDCYKHIYRRSSDLTLVFERPQRLRFLHLGLATALAWCRSSNPFQLLTAPHAPPAPVPLVSSPQLIVSRSTRRISPSDPAVRVVHPSPEQLILPASPSVDRPLASQAGYLDHLVQLCRQAPVQHQLGRLEVPEHLPQGDLYLSAGTEYAVLGAVGACYDGLDSILGPNSQATKAFVNIRPPGHHCTPIEPMGFCWLNNLLVACVHAHQNYSIDRICILDIDLHHGNGSQAIVWALNQVPSSTLKLSYSSIHDLNSYPCEDGDPDKLRDACLNVCLAQSVNQYVQNIHLEHWADEKEFFDRLYPSFWGRIHTHMQAFLTLTDAQPDRTMIFVSAGFDACEHETQSMSRYGMKLPTAFYHRFARDLGSFANVHAHGRILSVLEGGYSERTLMASSLSYLLGLLASDHDEVEEENGPAWMPFRLSRVSDAVLRYPHQEQDDELVNWTRKIFRHIDGFERAQAEMRSEARKAVSKLAQSQALAGNETERRMKLRSGRLASGGTDKPPKEFAMPGLVPATESPIEGLFERLSITRPSMTDTGRTEQQLCEPVLSRTSEPEEAQLELGVTEESTRIMEQANSEINSEVKPQRLKLVWKSEGLNG